jgi:hypothetical protein
MRDNDPGNAGDSLVEILPTQQLPVLFSIRRSRSISVLTMMTGA